MPDPSLSLPEAQSRFLDQLQRWQDENNGQPVARTSAEWQVATGLDDKTLTRVRQALRDQGVLRVEPVMAWSFVIMDEVA
jgi:hypothetical protein